MADTLTSGIITSFGNTPQANADEFGYIEDGGTVWFDVMANDLGGKAKTLYSIDGTDDGVGLDDLLTKDLAGFEELSAAGAKIWIGTDITDGKVKVAYNAGSIFDYLGEGDTATDTFRYAIRLSNGAISWGTVTFTITGTNDGPVLSDTTDPTAVAEAGDASAQNLAAITGNFSVTDLDVGDTLDASVVGSPTVLLNSGAFVLPVGAAALTAAGVFTLTDTTSNGGAVNIGYSYDPAAANLDFLREGDSLTITYTVKVNDGTADSGTQDVTFTITGTNDGPTITGTVTEDGTLTTGNTLTVSDVDTGENKFKTPTTYVSHVDDNYTIAGAHGIFTFDIISGVWAYLLNNSDSAVQALNTGQTLSDSITVQSFDGTNSQAISVTINGVTDASASDPNDFDNALGVSTGIATEGNDVLVGTSGTDTINALGSNDTIYGVGGSDTLSGGDNNDTIYGGSGDDIIYGGSNNDTIYGGNGNDTIQGDANVDTIYGGSGDDIINGNGGNDNIYGGYGNDTITVSTDNDKLFYLSKLDGNDIISEFDSDNTGGQDTIDLDTLFDTYGTMSGVRAGHVSIVQSGLDALVQIDTDNTIGSYEMVITLTGVTASTVTVGADVLVGS